VATTGTPLTGYRAWTPGYTWQEKTGQGINRFIGSTNATWRPFTWNQTRLTFGTDLTDRVDDNLLYRGEGPPITTNYRLGFKYNGRDNIRNSTLDLTSGANFNPTAWLNSRTTIGTQYVNYKFDGNQCGGTELPPGAQTCSSLITRATGDNTETTTITKTLGFFVEEAVGIHDRLFLTAALRTDQNSAFGTDFQSVWYPKFAASYVISDEGFFPQWGWLNSLRLRTAYGAAGVQPGPNDALRTISTAAVNVKGVDTPTLTNNALGNTELKPERTTELEGGFEMKMLNNRLSLDVTGYQKRTKDALISAVIAPSVGTGATNVLRNLGAVRNRGLEVLTNAQIIDRKAFAFDVTVNGSTNSNQLLDLGGTPPQIGVSTRVIEGYPLFGWWAQPITGYEDKNKDGILTYNANPSLNEVTVGDSSIFRGYTQPRHIVTATPWVRVPEPQARACRRCSTTAAATRRTTTPSAFAARAVRTATVSRIQILVGGAGDGGCHARPPVQDARRVLSGRRLRQAARDVGPVVDAESRRLADQSAQCRHDLLGPEPRHVVEVSRYRSGERLHGHRWRRRSV
jgi:outer membrane receptor protein involved in Fe transport